MQDKGFLLRHRNILLGLFYIISTVFNERGNVFGDISTFDQFALAYNTGIIIFLSKYKEKSLMKVELIKVHHLGENKYKSSIDGRNSVRIPSYKGIIDKFMKIYKCEIVG